MGFTGFVGVSVSFSRAAMRADRVVFVFVANEVR